MSLLRTLHIYYIQYSPRRNCRLGAVEITMQSLSMIKTQLTQAAAEKAGISKVEAKNTVEMVLDTVTESLKNDDKLSLPGFCVFSTFELPPASVVTRPPASPSALPRAAWPDSSREPRPKQCAELVTARHFDYLQNSASMMGTESWPGQGMRGLTWWAGQWSHTRKHFFPKSTRSKARLGAAFSKR